MMSLPWKYWLARAGLIGIAREAGRRVTSAGRARVRSETLELADFLEQVRPLRFDIALQTRPKRLLVVGMQSVRAVSLESIIVQAFRAAGYEITVLASHDYRVARAYRALGVNRIIYFDDLWRPGAARALPAHWSGETVRALSSLEHDGIACGKYALSTMMRRTRNGLVGLGAPELKRDVGAALRYSFEAADVARRVLERERPDAALFLDRGYSPAGELFDACVANGVVVYTWNAAHRNNTLMLKRYTAENRDVHPSSLSAQSWSAVQKAPWGEREEHAVVDELVHCYDSGEWYGEVGTQFNKSSVTADLLRERLQLDPAKRTAVIFPHIFWDATFFWGVDLFDDYEHWFLEVVRAAAANDRLNWIIKVHPANVIKDRRDGVVGLPSELRLLNREFAELPGHIRVIPADTDISTLSLYAIMDYCLTVRGTVGIEAACFGKQVLTAGTGRYDGLGFTLDASDRAEYLNRLGYLEQLPLPSADRVERARRYAYGVFLCRPLPLSALQMEYRQDSHATLHVAYRAQFVADLLSSPDIRGLVGWIESGAEDFFAWPARRESALSMTA
jgi:hypothetical protein